MKIYFFGVSNLFCSWNFSGGIPATLRRMGHEVYAFPPHVRDVCDISLPRPDFILVSGPEHCQYLNPTGIPSVHWYHETADRADHDFAPTYESLCKRTQLNYFIRKADAERFGGKWLPFAVDETIFNTVGAPPWEQRQHKIAFVGQLYEQRRKFLDEYRKLGGPEIEILQFVGEGKSPKGRAKELADSHRNTQIFVVLPTLIRTTPCKVFEAAACGASVVVPMVDEWERGAWLYHEDAAWTLVDAIKLAIKNPDAVKDFAAIGYEFVMTQHRLEQRLQRIIDDVKGLR